MKSPAKLVIVIATILLTGCQTITQSETPSLYVIQSKMKDGTENTCRAKTDKNTKVKNVHYTFFEMATDSSGWVRAIGKDQQQGLEGRTFYNVRTGRTLCTPRSIVPPFLTSDWEKLTEEKAKILLSSSTYTYVKPQTNFEIETAVDRDQWPTLPKLMNTMEGTVNCSDLKVEVPVKITSSIRRLSDMHRITVQFKPENPRYDPLKYEYKFRCLHTDDSCKGRFENDDGKGYFTISDYFVMLELDDQGETCVYKNND